VRHQNHLLLSQVNGYPSSPFDTTPLVFKKPYRHLVTLEDSIKTAKGEMPCDEVQSAMCFRCWPCWHTAALDALPTSCCSSWLLMGTS
jgi:hypothetical protein